MAGVNISSVVEKLEGDLVRTREKGIEDLRYLLASSRNGNKLKGLGDDGFHRIFESLYRIIRSDKAAFLKSSAQSKVRPSSTSRLSGSATALRLAVEAGVSKIRFKTAVSVIDHIIAILPTADGSFFEPLRNDYLKCFRILLEYQPYGEHLKTRQWQEFVDFTVDGISACLADDEQDGNHGSGRDTSMTSRSGSHRSLLVSQSSGQRTPRYNAKNSLDDLLATLRALVHICNAPITTKASNILNSVLECLISVPRAQDVALEIFNILALTLKTENVDLLVRGLSRLVPVLHRLWSSKSTALRDQILVTLSIIHPFFLASHRGIGYHDPFLREKILEILENDYIERAPREMLQLEEISLQLSSFQTNRPGYVLVPVRDSPRAVTNWSLLCTTASLVCSLTSTSSKINPSSDDGQPSKRRKLTTPTHEVFNRAIHSDGHEKLVAIQILYFLYNQSLPIPELVQERLPELESSLLSDDPQIVGWVMLLFSRFSWSDLALEPKFHGFWLKVQEHIRRAMAASSTSRAACLLIDAMLRRRILASSINAAGIQYLLFSGGKNGPAAFSDASLLMFTTILQSDYMDRDEAFEVFTMKIVGWLELYWNLPSVLDRSHNAQIAFHGQPELLCSLVAAMCGSLLHFEVYSRYSEPHAVIRADALIRESNEFSTYLAGVSSAATTDTRPNLRIQERQLSKEVNARLHHTIFEMLKAKSKAFLSAWTSYAHERSSNIGDDIITIMASICITIKANLASAAIEPSSHVTVTKAENECWQRIIDLLTQEHGDARDSRAIHLSFIVLRLRDPQAVAPILSKQFLSMSKSLLDITKSALEAANDEDSSDIDMMDSMDTRVSQGSQSASALGPTESMRRELIQSAMGNTSLVSCVLELAIQSARGVSNRVPDSDSMSRLVDDIVALDAGLLLMARQSMYELLHSQPSLARSDASRLLKHLAKSWLQDEEYERSEAAICCCAKIMTKLAPLWTSDTDDDLTDCAFDIYGWLIDMALAKSMASSQALFHVAQMLDVVSGLSPNYGSNDDLPSPRTSLLKILLNGPIGLKYRLSVFLPRMFDRYILSEHGAIFNDIVDALPSDPGSLEGIGVRFHILAELGSSWHTILRQSTYHLFETAIHVPGLTELGKLCVQRMSEAMKLPSAKHLFRAFSPQIFYTWLGVGEIQQVPFEEFGYETLVDLISENESELVAQTALRGSKEHAQALSHLLNSTWKQLLDKHFAHAEAYCLASQTSLPDREQLYIGSEALIRKDLSTEAYTRNLRDQLPSVIATLFITLQDDHGIERAFEKSSLSQPLSILRKICEHSSSSMTLPVGQQPSFRAKFVIEEIEWLCKRTDLKFDVIWAPALLTHVYRALLHNVNPALGPLHAAAILRKIRAVISLGGASAVKGYPLEMLLHALRPFLTIFQCSEDALGIYWYLLDAGKEYLQSHLSFLAGLGVSIFASLTTFITSSQESTTQESHFLSTMSKAKEFQKWLGKYLSILEPEGEDDDRVDNFRKLIRHAKSMTAGGNSSRSSPEGNVLLCLLRDRTTKNPLLNEMHFYLSLGILCKSFSPASEPSDDIVIDQEDLASYTPILQAILHRLSLPDTFRTWAAYAIGKACSAVGPDALQAQEATEQKFSRSLSNNLPTSPSYSAILDSLQSLIWQEDLETVAAAEQCLHEIATTLDPSTAVALLGKDHDQRLLDDLRFIDFPCPKFIGGVQTSSSRSALELWQPPEDSSAWASTLVLSLCDHSADDPILGTLRQFALSAPSAAGGMLPYVVHIVLTAELNRAQSAKNKTSEVFVHALKESTKEFKNIVKVTLDTLLYLRRCSLPTEGTLAQRNHWLEIDFGDAADAAADCEMWHAALLFIEIQQSETHLLASRSTRRSTQAATTTIPEVTAKVLQRVDDPDFFYAGHEDVDLSSIVQRLEHESSGFKTLAFRSAAFDAAIRTQEDRATYSQAASSAARALSAANLKGISQAVTSLVDGQSQTLANRDAGDMFFDLFDWDIHSEKGETEGKRTSLKALRALNSASSTATLVQALDVGLLQSIDDFPRRTSPKELRARSLCSLATLAEARDSLSLSGLEEFNAFLEASATVEEWSQRENIEQVSPLLNGREYLFGTIRRNEELRTALSLSQPQALLIEARVIRQSLQVAEHHSASQFSLSRATYLSRLTENANKMGLHLEAASHFALARTFWSQGEISASVKILQRLKNQDNLQAQDILVPTSEILAELGTKAAEARLEPPDEIIANYLIPAYKELGGNTQGSEAGKVFHNFAAFCDGQLQDPDSRDDYTRVEKIRETKLLEMEDLERLIKSREGRNKEVLKSAYNKAKTWFRLDDEEFQRLQANREALILRCLENYLLSMKACDDFPNDSLRVLSIWLDQSHSERVNDTVHKYLQQVPSIKFAALVNQLTSRLMDSKDAFPQILMDLMFRICSDHPYHGMYQLFAASKSKGAKSDELANSRHVAAGKLGELLRAKSPSGKLWISLHNASIAFVRVAQERLSEKEMKTGAKFLLRDINHGAHLIRTVEGADRRIPPPTMKIALRADRDYSTVPVMRDFEPQVSIAGGISAPKITTVLASDGSRNKMLLKGGNDDLRQDSIMEQVFEEVSNLLKDHRATRQRKLGIRTYKVVPLVSNAGIIEFVQNTLPLHDYLLPAHKRYFPKDYRHTKCREEIAKAQTSPLKQRIQAYRNATANFHPVMRFFFTEHFLDPDEWFYKRLNYSRSTAAISILGHVLGLGDRHGHNILLDTNTGEVVHIDLGVAFEAGRILPVPEVVPFRLTRDLVDGMGISGVKGVFQRCCNFTLEALRRDQESIMTILDVLRYDPLYSWSLSPIRLQKMQENAEQAAAAAAAGKHSDTNATGITDNGAAAAAGMGLAGGVAGAGGAGAGGRKDINEPSEADRALTVVAKKLGKTLSVEATVNELIRQATDERNLAVLYCGWAAYA